MYHIRFAKKEDVEKIAEIEKVSYSAPWSQTAFKFEISKSQAGESIFVVAVADETNEVLGYIMGDKIVDFIHVSNIAVVPTSRKQGIGNALLSKLEEEALKLGMSTFTLEVRAVNTSAVNLYKRHGYEEKGRREKYYENKDDAIIMWKKDKSL
ncbi:MAG: ribosomal protein S18-alanine N-acetyltransferase [bacterium]